ncbi:hypothetical protein BG004_003662 [Podila humilis]|nr:hypothetical protein BG004_003662 [Podila humilis]
MSDKKGQYAHLPQDPNDADHEQASPQPPPYTPSTAPSSPFIEPHQLPFAASSSSASAPPIPNHPQQHAYPSIYPALNYPAQQQHQQHQQQQQRQQQPFYHVGQPNYQAISGLPDTSKPPPPLPHVIPSGVGLSPQMVLVKPPSRIEELRVKPGVVACQHCHHLVLTETTPENGSCTYLGILALILAGVTSCGCCLLPLCMTSCKDVMHSCPNCHEDIGLYSRIKERTFPTRPVRH